MITSFLKNNLKWSLILVVAIYSQCTMDAQKKPTNEAEKTETISSESANTKTISSEPDYTASNPGWHVRLEEAYAESQKTGNPIMANFTGSDWCGWCKRLTASVFSKPEFQTWAAKNVVLLELDFPRRTKLPEDIQQQNYGLQNSFQVNGYPTVWVFNLSKDNDTNQFSIEALGKTGYSPSVDDFIKGVEAMIKK